MTDTCCCPSQAGSAVCELSEQNLQRPRRVVNACPVCGEKGKPVQTQTVRALLSVSLREVLSSEYLFCRTQTCPVVYFASDGERVFTVQQVRERIYQKNLDADDVHVCYCFRYAVGDIRAASTETRAAIVDEISAGIKAEQCACDLRNPQGSCCLGNVRGLISQLQKTSVLVIS